MSISEFARTAKQFLGKKLTRTSCEDEDPSMEDILASIRRILSEDDDDYAELQPMAILDYMECKMSDFELGDPKYKNQSEPSMEDILASVRRILTEDEVKDIPKLENEDSNEKHEPVLELKNEWMVPGNLNELREFFNEVPPSSLANLLKDEYPQTVALVISNLDPKVTSGIMESLPENFAMEVLMRTLRMESVPLTTVTDVLMRLKQSFSDRERTFYRTPSERHEFVAKFLSKITKTTNTRMLNSLMERNRESWGMVATFLKEMEDKHDNS